ncbi:unnamed protein product [Toxocara canis]|uniref:DUF3331 domain-containing protein n=1 Tax=Toxocara canis TaxID=6265 RepID=A0A183UKE8_TOXCA|nr:unnamed protein product [Toxocara canis]
MCVMVVRRWGGYSTRSAEEGSRAVRVSECGDQRQVGLIHDMGPAAGTAFVRSGSTTCLSGLFVSQERTVEVDRADIWTYDANGA